MLFPVKGSDLSTLNTAVQIITNRVDALGVAEPEVNRQGNTIVINLPGAKNRTQALALVGRTAELQFRVVTSSCPTPRPPDRPRRRRPTTTTDHEPGTTTTGEGPAPRPKGPTTTTRRPSTTAKKGALGASAST